MTISCNFKDSFDTATTTENSSMGFDIYREGEKRTRGYFRVSVEGRGYSV